MNDTRRKALRKLAEKLEDIRAEIESLKDEEQEYRDSMPENLQGSERYEASEDADGNMDDAIEYLYSAIESIESAAE